MTWISVARNLFDPLLEIDADGKLVPGLASGWQWLDDRTLSVRKTPLQLAPSETQPLRSNPNDAEQVALGQRVYVSFCAGCHGANLEGQPDWQKRLPLGNFPAPPHDATGLTWHHAHRWLFDIIKDGGQRFAPPRYRSAMPAYRDMLADEEIWAVLAFIKSR